MCETPANGSLFKALPSKRAFDEIADQIKDLIYLKTLKPGDKLPPERDLATQFETGIMAVREAVKRHFTCVADNKNQTTKEAKKHSRKKDSPRTKPKALDSHRPVV